jgi:hypothetical protein
LTDRVDLDGRLVAGFAVGDDDDVAALDLRDASPWSPTLSMVTSRTFRSLTEGRGFYVRSVSLLGRQVNYVPRGLCQITERLQFVRSLLITVAGWDNQRDELKAIGVSMITRR